MQKWEYKRVRRVLRKKTKQPLIGDINDRCEWGWDHDANDKRTMQELLNAFGAEGWELVSEVPIETSIEIVGSHERATEIAMTFKRPLRTAPPED